MNGVGQRERPRAVRGAPEAQVPRVLVYSRSVLIGEGLVELLPTTWRDKAVIATAVTNLAEEVALPPGAAIIDLGSGGAGEAVGQLRELGASVILLLVSAEDLLDDTLARDADAILLRDEVDARALRMALAAGALGLRVTPRAWSLPSAGGHRPSAEAAERAPLGEPAQRALELLAGGLRDAEIARELNLSESATRKLIQRAVRRTGARTRCQAVAAAVRGGDF